MVVSGTRSFLGRCRRDGWVKRYMELNHSTRWYPLLGFEGTDRILKEWQKETGIPARFRRGLQLAYASRGEVNISHELTGLPLLHDIQRRMNEDKTYNLDFNFWRDILNTKP